MFSYVHAAMFDAVVAAYHAKYTHRRSTPQQLASDLTPAAATLSEPSYPSEHAAVAAAAAAVLAHFYPNSADQFAALAQEVGQTRLVAATNFRSDVEAGLALGRAVAEKAIARAQTDGSDAVYTGTPPTGPGVWTGTPADPMVGTWKPWILTSGSQIRPGPPPAFDSPEFAAALAEVKRLTAGATAFERAVGQFWTANGNRLFIDLHNALVIRDRLSTAQAARVAATMFISGYDCTIAGYDAKYAYWTIRPYQVDPSIPLMVRPPSFPAFPSTFTLSVASWSETLAHFFPDEAERLRLMASQAGMARVYQGIHYRHDVVASEQMARRVVAFAIERDQQNEN
jgi:hypothetical protein